MYVLGYSRLNLTSPAPKISLNDSNTVSVVPIGPAEKMGPRTFFE